MLCATFESDGEFFTVFSVECTGVSGVCFPGDHVEADFSPSCTEHSLSFGRGKSTCECHDKGEFLRGAVASEQISVQSGEKLWSLPTASQAETLCCWTAN